MVEETCIEVADADDVYYENLMEGVTGGCACIDDADVEESVSAAFDYDADLEPDI
ncbi:MAG: hypothetical protein MJY82_03845 [Fibrobacter sp.]|nr:hypothetical protein [Fibrobacter sp.]